MKNTPTHARLIGLTLLALLLFMPPLLLLSDRPGTLGFSWLPLYIFIVWLSIIGLAAWILERDHES